MGTQELAYRISNRFLQQIQRISTSVVSNRAGLDISVIDNINDSKHGLMELVKRS